MHRNPPSPIAAPAPAPDYLNPNLPSGLRTVRIPTVEATAESLEGYGLLVDDPKAQKVEIVRWPARGWRGVDIDSGNEGGTTRGTFVSEWKGDVLYGRNDAVGGHYILGYNTLPEQADNSHRRPPERLMLWHCNYHPDGGQMFFPLEPGPFLVPLARPGDDVKPEDFTCFWFKGGQGLYMHPNVWHEGVFSISGRRSFYDEQGAIHARVSVNFATEFGCLLEMGLDVPGHA
ncbi:MAG: ureidoglycolate hydrolase [Comamonadaceae bacterium]|nr:MAG: ureidoglycolate hydrolase [Comamonadaceae bacterium]